MIVIVKSFSGCDYTLSNGRVISLKGGCYLNEVEKSDFELLCKEFPSVEVAIESGHIVTKSNKELAKKQTENEVADTISDAQKAQDSKQSENAKATGAKTTKRK